MVIIKLQKSYQCQFLWLCGCYQNCQEQKQNYWTLMHHVSIKTKQKKKQKKTKSYSNLAHEYIGAYFVPWINKHVMCSVLQKLLPFNV